MKKLFVLLLVLTMVFTLAACGDSGKTPSGSTDKPDASQSNAPDNQGPGDAENTGDYTQKQMEDTIVSYFSDISSLTSLTLCGGSSIDYEAAGMIMTVDVWTINDPDMSYEDLAASMQEQLSDGFEYEVNAIGGHDWTVAVGDKEMRIQLRPESFFEGAYVIYATPEPTDE